MKPRYDCHNTTLYPRLFYEDIPTILLKWHHSLRTYCRMPTQGHKFHISGIYISHYNEASATPYL